MEVVYSIKCEGRPVITISGPGGFHLMSIALGIAARESFLHREPVNVLENGVLFRVVSVTTR